MLTELEADAGEAARALAGLLRDRFTCRAYLPDAVPRALITKIAGIAQFTPSWCNTQPWKLYITEGETTRRFATELYAHAASGARPETDFPFPARYDGVYDTRRRECAAQLYGSLGIAMGDRASSLRQTLENFRLFDAPHVAIVTTAPELGAYGAVDCGLYVSNFLLAARAFGIATTPQAALASYAPLVRAQLGIPEDRWIVCGISFG